MLAVMCVLAFDAIGALAARFVGFDYAVLRFISWIIPVGAGYIATHENPWYMGTLAGLFTAFVDATLGWVFTSAVGVGQIIGLLSFNQVVTTMLITLLMGAAWGTLGGGLQKLIKRTHQTERSHA